MIPRTKPRKPPFPDQIALAAVRSQAMTDSELAAWHRNWHWADCAEDKPVDLTIYPRDVRMLKAFAAFMASRRATPSDGTREALEMQTDELVRQALAVADGIEHLQDSISLRRRTAEILRELVAALSPSLSSAHSPSEVGK